MSEKINLLNSLGRLKMASSETASGSEEEFIVRNLRLGGRRVSFAKREYQQRVLQSEARIIAVKKCSQVGISELILMRNLARCCLREPFNIIHALPTVAFAQKIAKTRIDPLIQGSAYLSSRVNKTLDNASVKQLGHSFLYVNGTHGSSSSSAISIPADEIVIDELDFCNAEVVSNLQSRLTASAWRGWTYVSTPTIPNFGIDAKFQVSKRYFNYCKCSYCNHWFLPKYLDHVRIPDFSRDLLGISASDLASVRWQEAKLFCPNCGKEPNLLPQYREWICENPLDNFEADGFMISPMDAPQIISPSDLVSWSTRFKNKNMFVNFHLGEAAESADAGLNETDLQTMERVGQQPLAGFRVFGLDMGATCHLVVGVTDGQGRLNVVELHQIRYTELDEKLALLLSRHRPTMIVADSQPYTETIHRLQQKISNLYGSVYVNSRNMEAFKVVDREENPQKSLLDVRQVNVNRNLALNLLMADIREGKVGVVQCAELPTFSAHLTDMKRQSQSFAAFGGEADDAEPDSYAWVKTTGNDHYHHALLYAYVASQMTQHLPQGRSALLPFVGSFRVR